MILRSFFVLCLWSQVCLSQENATIKQLLLNNKNLNNKEVIIKVDSTLKSLEKNQKSLKKERQRYLTWLYKQKKYHKVQTTANELIQKLNKKEVFDTLFVQNLYNYLGLSSYKLNNFSESISFYQSAIQLSENTPFAGEIYSNLGKAYNRKADYYNSTKYFLLGQKLLLKYDRLNELFKNYINITLPYNHLKTKEGYIKSRKFLLKADSIAPYTSFGKKYTLLINMGLGNSYNHYETLDIQKASSYYKEAIAISKKTKDFSRLAAVYSSLGNLYNITNPDLGIEYQKKSLNYLSKNDSINYSINYGNIGYCYSTKGLLNKSVISYLKSIEYLTGINNILLELSLEKTLSNKNSLLIRLKGLGNTYFKQFKKLKNIKNLNKSISTFILADQLLDLILIESQEFQSKLFWREQSAELYGKAIEACFLADDTEKAFYFMEKNKALLLNQHIRKQQLKQSLQLPDSIVNLEIQLKKDIFDLERLKTNKNIKDSISISLLGKERSLQKLQDSLEKNYSDYKAISTKTKITGLKEVQKNLDEQSVILTYTISQYDDYSLITPENKYRPVIPNCNYGVKTFHPAYGMLITHNSVDFFKLDKADLLKDEIQKFLSLAKKPFRTQNDITTYNKIAYKLFSVLLPKAYLSKIKNKKLRIVPDNYLNYLPFEALVTSNKEQPSYWIQENEISYAYSNSFLESIPKNNIKASCTFVGFAPVTFSNDELTDLIESENELEAIQKHYDAKLFLREKASKKSFLKALPDYKIIHLATHADAQDSISPWIAFKKEKLLQEELSLTTNNAQLVVLSGCNTLLGKDATGEGVMSLARGFFQSGAQSVMSSLWKVDDQSTSLIMNQFYKNLSKGQSKSKALQKSKLNYLNNHSLSQASPYYWASFVMLGDTDPLNKSSNFWIIAFCGCTLIALALLLFYFYKRKK